MLFAYFNKYIFTVIFVILFTLLIKYLKLIPKVYYSNLSFGLLATVPIIIVTFVLSYTWRLKKMTATDAITNLILNLIFTAFIQQYLLWSSFTVNTGCFFTTKFRFKRMYAVKISYYELSKQSS